MIRFIWLAFVTGMIALFVAIAVLQEKTGIRLPLFRLFERGDIHACNEQDRVGHVIFDPHGTDLPPGPPRALVRADPVGMLHHGTLGESCLQRLQQGDQIVRVDQF